MNQNVINNSGAFTDLINILKEKSIFKFNSINDIIDYKRNYQNEIEKIKKEKTNEILDEINQLVDKNKNIYVDYNSNKEEQNLYILNQIEKLKLIINNDKNNLFLKIKKYFSKKKVNYLESNINQIIEKSLRKYLHEIEKNENRINYLTTNQNDEINKRAYSSIKEIEYIVTELNNLSPLIYGSIGELKAIDLLKQLPDQYYIINDFRETFNPPLYNKSEDERIFSTQLDHIVVGPTGVYVIETKFWNQKSINSNILFSPIKQLKRGGFALFMILNDNIKNQKAKMFFNNWGLKKISVSNILLMMNSSTNEQFQFVKVLTENNLIDYITKRPIVLNEEQVKFIVNILK